MILIHWKGGNAFCITCSTTRRYISWCCKHFVACRTNEERLRRWKPCYYTCRIPIFIARYCCPVWYFILQYLDTVESRHLEFVECLIFLFQLNFSTIGKNYSTIGMTVGLEISFWQQIYAGNFEKYGETCNSKTLRPIFLKFCTHLLYKFYEVVKIFYLFWFFLNFWHKF